MSAATAVLDHRRLDAARSHSSLLGHHHWLHHIATTVAGLDFEAAALGINSGTVRRRFSAGEEVFDVNRFDMQEYQGVVTRVKAKQLKSHKDQIEQEKFQGLNFDVQNFMGLKF
ncbi:hypothetical protein M9H77_03282 [Catharanthus roseus]|uniref:Uncharacterized protein n=1 Tax=Catharanthus roseus TaxID=4058 RepID=A0ACC0CAS4_CATRO|nr:hypothetical protein M9H77_03282 [Catharanthus roseus]